MNPVFLHLTCCLRPWTDVADSAEEDQPPHMCSLILLFTLCCCIIDPLPDNKILGWSKLKQIADHILETIYNEK